MPICLICAYLLLRLDLSQVVQGVFDELVAARLEPVHLVQRVLDRLEVCGLELRLRHMVLHEVRFSTMRNRNAPTALKMMPPVDLSASVILVSSLIAP